MGAAVGAGQPGATRVNSATGVLMQQLLAEKL